MPRFHAPEGRKRCLGLTVFLLLLAAANVTARDVSPKSARVAERPHRGMAAVAGPVVEYTAHNRGNIQLAIANNGTFGTLGRSIPDPFTGEPIPSCIYPKNSDLVYLWVAAIWIGAVVGRDTLVSVGDEDFYVTNEFWPEVKPFGEFTYQSIDPRSPFYSPDAYSEEDILCEYTDTLTGNALVAYDPVDNRPHIPLNIKVSQRSMAWSYSYAEDFILFNYQVENIGVRMLNDVYLGIWVDGDVWHTSRKGPMGWNDDLVGFYRSHPAPEGCGFIDTINVAYHTDNDGDPVGGQWDYASVPHVVGIRVVRTPSDSLKYSFNWWIINYGIADSDFGPRCKGTSEDPFRRFGERLGTPQGDKNKYYILRHEEFDYDLLHTALDHSRQGWLPPPEDAETYARGFDCRYLLSFGPFDIRPGQMLPISFAWLAGADLHTDPTNFENLFNPLNPNRFYQSLDFSNLAANSRWASWVYDNPGVDTDKDGYCGKSRICCTDSIVHEIDTTINGKDTIVLEIQYTVCDTFWYEGDGVPDFVGAGPPPAPDFWVYPTVGSLRIRFNGLLPETTRDVFSQEIDFEGYRVYLARDDRPTSYYPVASYDIEDFTKLVYKNGEYLVLDNPFSLHELKCIYGDSCGDPYFNPLAYSPAYPYVHPKFPESTFYFKAQDFNVSEPGLNTPIRKLYPNQPYPTSLCPDSAQVEELTEDGYLKYYEYELVLDNLLPTVPYLVNVTAFDFGSPKAGLPALETSVANGARIAYALSSADDVLQSELVAYVYPNPYRIDGDYATRGFENREGVLAVERARQINFANLPPRCTIRIYTPDGDLVRELIHDKPPSDPTASHEQWNLITRNTQAVVTGLYYFVVESEGRTQIGKFAIIK